MDNLKFYVVVYAILACLVAFACVHTAPEKKKPKRTRIEQKSYYIYDASYQDRFPLVGHKGVNRSLQVKQWKIAQKY